MDYTKAKNLKDGISVQPTVLSPGIYQPNKLTATILQKAVYSSKVLGKDRSLERKTLSSPTALW